MMKCIINNDYLNFKEFLKDCIINFDTKGESFVNQKRNSLRLFYIDDFIINVKSFRIPNFINQIAYKFFRKSKAQRSYEFGMKLIDIGIKTPRPIAYFEFTSFLLFRKSYYLSEHLDCDLTYRELTKDLDYPDHENILRAFTRFTFGLHEKGVNFLDHSPGNTLIKKVDEEYRFYLVDLNRMKFKPMNFETCIKNFERLTIHKSMVETMSDEYAKISGENYNKVFNLMWSSTQAFQEKFQRKKRLKKKLKLW